MAVVAATEHQGRRRRRPHVDVQMSRPGGEALARRLGPHSERERSMRCRSSPSPGAATASAQQLRQSEPAMKHVSVRIIT